MDALNLPTGRVVFRGDPGWEESRVGFGARFDYDSEPPLAVAFARSSEDVVACVRWAKANGIPLRIRSGRHSFEGYSSLVEDGIVVDVSELRHFDLDEGARIVRIGPGWTCGELAEKLADYGLGLPLATGPSVGLGGLVLGGGFGITSRMHGLMCDNAIGFEIATAQGDLSIVDDTSHADLFWALRGGGGGNFGIVTSMSFTAHPIRTVGAFQLVYAWSDFEAVVDKWQRWNYYAPDAITSFLSLRSDGVVSLQGQYSPQGEELSLFEEVLGPMMDDPKPIDLGLLELPSIVSARIAFGVGPTEPYRSEAGKPSQLFKSSSAIANDFLPNEAIARMKEFLESVPPLTAEPSQPSMIQLLGGGGAGADVAPDATAVWHRNAKVIVQYDGYWTDPADAAPTMGWVREMREGLLPYASGAYVNYHDADLGEGFLEAYFGGNVERLKRVKEAYDPENFFCFAQSLDSPR